MTGMAAPWRLIVALATAALQRLLEDPPAPAYVFAYEAYAALGSAYLRPLLAFLKLPLVAGGDYAVASAVPFDLFPMTRHVEAVVTFDRVA